MRTNIILLTSKNNESMRKYNYEWGCLTVEKDGKYYDFHYEDWKLLVDSLWNGTIVQKDGKYGVIDPQGKEVLPCVFDQIEKLRESVFGRLNSRYWELEYMEVARPLVLTIATLAFLWRTGKRDGRLMERPLCQPYMMTSIVGMTQTIMRFFKMASGRISKRMETQC